MKKLILILFFVVAGCDSGTEVAVANKVVFTVEMAVTPSQKAQGLMFRQSLCDTCGMLFDFQQPKKVGMWMKDTELSLDMLFINAQKEVVFMAKRTTPFSLEMIQPQQPIRYVLEVKGGMTDKYNIQIGDKVTIR